VLKVPLNTNQQ